MQSVKPLRLKRETYRIESAADTSHIAHVWVDSGLSHLDGIYSYRIPNNLISYVVLGSRIKVPFNGRSCEAIVLETSVSDDALGNLKIIESLLDKIPVANSRMLLFYRQMAEYWASDAYSIIRSGIPSRVAAIEKKFDSFKIMPEMSRSRRKIQRTFLMHEPYRSSYADLVKLALARMNYGSTLLLLPDVKDVNRVFELLSNSHQDHQIIRLDSSIPRSARYENYLHSATAEKVLVIGTRSALFAPIRELDSIIVGFEKSEQYFEQKHPFWNVRDSAFIRSEIESCNLFFTGYVPSAEMAYQIEQRRVLFSNKKNSVSTFAFPQEKGELLPDRIIRHVKNALRDGKVLFLAPRKGYANALLCSKCKNMSLCSCGGRLSLSSQSGDPTCTICAMKIKDWKCSWCGGNVRYAASRGIERFSEEIGRAFPNNSIQLSSAPNILEDISTNTNIVIATVGAIPGNYSDYSCVVILEGQRFLSSSSSSFEEMAYESFFEAASRIGKNGKVLVVLDSFHPIIAGLTRWNPSVLIKKILRENFEASLSPYFSSAVMRMNIDEAGTFKSGVSKSIKDGRLPESSKVYLSEDLPNNQARIFITVPRDKRSVLADFLRELNRKRAISKKSLISVALDPYALAP
jgi:primosomal protein N' (replication factor Y)